MKMIHCSAVRVKTLRVEEEMEELLYPSRYLASPKSDANANPWKDLIYRAKLSCISRGLLRASSHNPYGSQAPYGFLSSEQLVSILLPSAFDPPAAIIAPPCRNRALAYAPQELSCEQDQEVGIGSD